MLFLFTILNIIIICSGISQPAFTHSMATAAPAKPNQTMHTSAQHRSCQDTPETGARLADRSCQIGGGTRRARNGGKQPFRQRNL